jgi:hypothetical protein
LSSDVAVSVCVIMDSRPVSPAAGLGVYAVRMDVEDDGLTA